MVRYRQKAHEWAAKEYSKVRDIGPIPPIGGYCAGCRREPVDGCQQCADIRGEALIRRELCRESLRTFCEVYNHETFCLPWCADHLRMIERIEEAATLGALYAFAMPRGQGKTVIVRHAALWAISYALRRYVFVIGAEKEKATDTLNAIRMYIRFLPLYGDDFPEIAYPVRRLEGIAQRAHGQTSGGESTMLEWSADRIMLASVKPPANWPAEWPLKPDGLVPTAGAVVSGAGLTSEGIRGSVLTLTSGESVRPDLVLIDDPQTPESARSPTQNATREQLVSADILGLGGPGKTISAVMPCTVIAQGDFIDTILDRKKHPLWRGERTQLLRSMPANLDAWESYFELYRRCAQLEPPDFTEANAYYLARQEELDAGASASWAERKRPDEVSAIQSAMHIYCRDPRAFWAEMQNAPLLPIEVQNALKAGDVAARVNRVRCGVVPAGMSRLTAFIDVQQAILYYTVCAWNESFGGAVVDYGTFPKQNREVFTAADARPTLVQTTGIATLEGSVYAGLESLTDFLLLHEWTLATGGVIRIERCLIDAGWGAAEELVTRFCRQSKHAALLTPSKGFGITAGQSPMSEWDQAKAIRTGDNWVLRQPVGKFGRKIMFDANHWKTFVANRLRQPVGEKGSMLLFGDSADAHRMFADHVCAEYPERTFGRGREVDQWIRRPNMTENHWLDCLVGCTVAASFQGCCVPGAAPKKRGTYKISELYAKAHGAKK